MHVASINAKWCACPHHDAVVDEAPTVAGGFEVGVFFRTGHLDVPHPSPSLVQLLVDRVDARVVGGHSVTHVHWDVVLLDDEGRHVCDGVTLLLFVLCESFS